MAAELSISALAEDERGRIWIGAEAGGLFCVDGNRITPFIVPAEFQPGFVRHIQIDRDRVLWIGTTNGLIRFANGIFTRLGAGEGLHSNSVYAFAQDLDGGLWVGTLGGGVSRWHDGRMHTLTRANGLPSDDVLAVFADRSRNIWLGTRGGLCRWNDGRLESYSVGEGLSAESVMSILQDREGSFWIGTGYGLNQLKDPKVVVIDRRNGLPTDFAWSVFQDNQFNLWIGTNNFGAVRYRNGEAKVYSTLQGMGGAVVRCTYQDSQGNLWFGTGGGLSCMASGRFTTLTVNDGLDDNLVQSVFEDRNGVLWIGTSFGLNSLRAGKVSSFPFAGEIPRPLGVYYIFQDRAGELWLGTRHGAVRITDGKHQLFNTRQGFCSYTVYVIFQDEKGIYWFATADGLYAMRNGRFIRIGKREGLPDEVLYGMVRDKSNNFWFSSNRGVFRLAQSQLFGFLDGQISELTPDLFGVNEGMKSSECNSGGQSSGCLGRDGKVMFPTQRGVVVIDPALLKQSRILPAVRIEGASADGRIMPIDRLAVLPPGTNRLEFRFAAISFLAPEKNRFRYRLENFDREWTDAGSDRSVSYTNIPPGRYRFWVMASSHEGLWNKEAAGFNFSIKPYFFQTTLFYILSAAGLLLTGILVFQLRIASLKRRERHLSELVTERTRQLADANQELERLANLDGLTGVANRRLFDRTIEAEWKRTGRFRQPLSLLMIDVDFFKHYNDNHGHQMGDDCLRMLASILKKNVTRTGDLIARYGGEEFCIVLPATDEEGAQVVAERLRRSVADLKISHGFSSCADFVTISIGVATALPDQDETVDSLIAASDKALYQAKVTGRNRVVATALGP